MARLRMEEARNRWLVLEAVGDAGLPSSAMGGLDSEEAARRLDAWGYNRFCVVSPPTAFRRGVKWTAALALFLSLVLFLAGWRISAFLMMGYVVVVGACSLFRIIFPGKRRTSVSPAATGQVQALRGGEAVWIDPLELVPGDWAVMEEGNSFPAEVRVLAGEGAVEDPSGRRWEWPEMAAREIPVCAGSLMLWGECVGLVVSTCRFGGEWPCSWPGSLLGGRVRTVRTPSRTFRLDRGCLLERGQSLMHVPPDLRDGFLALALASGPGSGQEEELSSALLKFAAWTGLTLDGFRRDWICRDVLFSGNRGAFRCTLDDTPWGGACLVMVGEWADVAESCDLPDEVWTVDPAREVFGMRAAGLSVVAVAIRHEAEGREHFSADDPGRGFELLALLGMEEALPHPGGSGWTVHPDSGA